MGRGGACAPRVDAVAVPSRRHGLGPAPSSVHPARSRHPPRPRRTAEHLAGHQTERAGLRREARLTDAVRDVTEHDGAQPLHGA